MKDTFRVGIYARLSRDDNNGNLESMSIANQRQILSDYVNEKGWILVEEYVDEHVIIGTSGENLVKSRGSALVPFSFLLRDKPKSFKSLRGCDNDVKNYSNLQQEGWCRKDGYGG